MSDLDGLTSAFQHKGAERDTTTRSHVEHKLHHEAYPGPPSAGPDVSSQPTSGPDVHSIGTGDGSGASPSLAGDAAPGAYDAKAEAKKIENLAKVRLDTGDNGSHSSASEIAAAKALTSEWASLSARERSEVGTQLTKDYDNVYMNTLPRPTILKDSKGEVTGLEFEASVWDFHSGPHSLRIVDDGNQIVEKRNSPKGSAKWEAEYTTAKDQPAKPLSEMAAESIAK